MVESLTCRAFQALSETQVKRITRDESGYDWTNAIVVQGACEAKSDGERGCPGFIESDMTKALGEEIMKEVKTKIRLPD